jgi:G3E family GTPase
MAVGLMMLPAASARLWARTLPVMLALSAAFAFAASYVGLIVSFHAGLPSGPLIVLAAGGLYVVSLVVGRAGGALRGNVRQNPVTVLTGYLGAGKTTLLNRILSEDHGNKFAVIVNEFGEIGIDNDLVVGADEEVFEMNNGCICCTVRGDLIRIIEGLMKRKGKFDAIIVETTGLADPAPVAQTFFVDEDVQADARLDAVVTVADAKWLIDRLKDAPEAKNQIAFADVILLNKTDLVSPQRAARSRGAHSRHQPLRQSCTARRSCAGPLDAVLGRNAFDLDRILEIDVADHRRRRRSGEVPAMGQRPRAEGRPVDPALEGHSRLQERAEAFRLPGRAYDPGRRRAERMAARRKARQPHRLHRSSSQDRRHP